MKKEREFYSYIYNNINYFEGLESERIKKILLRIPKSESILEIGCGDGRILNRINVKYKVGVDFAIKPLLHIKNLAYAANVSYLPFSDDSFELVICSEVLEHLNKNTYHKALNEIFRVSSHYILISAPYNENLRWRVSKCIHCNQFFHASLHFRSFNEQNFRDLFQNCKLILLEKFGYRYSFPILFDRLKKITGNYFVRDNIICPYCGKKDPCKKVNLIGKIINIFEKIFKLIFFFSKRKLPVWILVIYKKTSSRSDKIFDRENILICPICHEKIHVKEEGVKCLNDHRFFYKNNILDLRV